MARTRGAAAMPRPLSLGEGRAAARPRGAAAPAGEGEQGWWGRPETRDLRLAETLRQRDIETGRDIETLRLWRPCGRAIGLAAISTCLNVSRHLRRVSGLMSHVPAPVPTSPAAGPARGAAMGGCPASGLNVSMSHVPPASLVSHVSCQRASSRFASGGPSARGVRVVGGDQRPET